MKVKKVKLPVAHTSVWQGCPALCGLELMLRAGRPQLRPKPDRCRDGGEGGDCRDAEKNRRQPTALPAKAPSGTPNAVPAEEPPTITARARPLLAKSPTRQPLPLPQP